MTDSSKARPSSSSRFIPKEELGDVAAWRFDDVSGHARRTAKAPELDPKERAALDKGYRAGFEAGRRSGEKTAELAVQAFHQTTGEHYARRIGELTASYEAQLRNMEQALAGQVLELSLDIARQMVRTELASNPLPVQRLVAEAVELMLAGSEIATVRLHPDDLDAVAAAMKPYTDTGKLRLLADGAITQGGCLVEAGLSKVDATTQRRWSQVLANFGQAAPPDATADAGPHVAAQPKPLFELATQEVTL